MVVAEAACDLRCCSVRATRLYHKATGIAAGSIALNEDHFGGEMAYYHYVQNRVPIRYIIDARSFVRSIYSPYPNSHQEYHKAARARAAAAPPITQCAGAVIIGMPAALEVLVATANDWVASKKAVSVELVDGAAVVEAWD